MFLSSGLFCLEHFFPQTASQLNPSPPSSLCSELTFSGGLPCLPHWKLQPSTLVHCSPEPGNPACPFLLLIITPNTISILYTLLTYYVVTLSLLEFKLYRTRSFTSFVTLMYPKCLVKYLAHGECSKHTCWIKLIVCTCSGIKRNWLLSNYPQYII